MGNSGSANGHFIKRDESFGSPRQKHAVDIVRSGSYFGSNERISNGTQRSPSFHKNNRSQSLEQSGTHSPSSSHSSSSNSYLGHDKNCLRQSAQPMFQISGDLNPQQIHLVKRTWKNLMKSINDDEQEIAIRLLLRFFQLEPRNVALFGLPTDVPLNELRQNPIFMRHVKAFEPTLIHVMSHPGNATTLSKYLQQLGGRHVQNTGVTYKSTYWKTFMQALVDVVDAGKISADAYEAFMVLGAFCVEQMRIGYKIEYKLQREAERIAKVQMQKRAHSVQSRHHKTSR
ncbi:unnamed protein product [Bursaphelenchus xylophilus]|uniref:(pine wood nematode) hypothetical protein n=1 Tax=Bursaphelenchus xylophilus TaxID=6326 RepID=A0A1I7S2V4_BURXY|nr:unnamed protein product [Bursaphelenchus xylophilus]CAG9121574.1 unnamed protein product [Bursaphelenchus xylophilus]